jgi:flavorubredoxin
MGVGVLKVLVAYDSVSEARVTAKVADAVASGLKGAGISVDVHFVGDAAKVNVADYDCLVLGAPTMAWRPSKRMKDFMAAMSRAEGKKAAAFDTQMHSAISGDATKHMEKALKAAGYAIVSESLLAYVKSENKVYKLNDGELEKAKAWGAELAKKLQ